MLKKQKIKRSELTIQLANISIPEVFERYTAKYHIYKELYEHDLKGLEIRGLDHTIARSLMQIFLDQKEFCYLHEASDGAMDLLAIGSYSKLKEISKDIVASGNEEIGLKTNRVFLNIAEYENAVFKLNGNPIDLHKPLMMGILNVTPDSFSDGGKFADPKLAINRATEFIENDFDIIDIGGESTRPGSNSVDAEEELARVIPVIESVLKKHPKAVISIDTTKSEVAKEALASGAKIVNDISALLNDPRMAQTANDFNAPVILMHMKGKPKNMQNAPVYDDVVSEIYDFLAERVEFAEKEGIREVVIDPGIGFGKRVSDNFEILKRLAEFKGIGKPMLIGLSRKSFLGKSLDLDVENRDFPTGIAETISALSGARIIRTHNSMNGKIIKKLVSALENPWELDV